MRFKYNEKLRTIRIDTESKEHEIYIDDMVYVKCEICEIYVCIDELINPSVHYNNIC